MWKHAEELIEAEMFWWDTDPETGEYIGDWGDDNF